MFTYVFDMYAHVTMKDGILLLYNMIIIKMFK